MINENTLNETQPLLKNKNLYLVSCGGLAQLLNWKIPNAVLIENTLRETQAVLQKETGQELKITSYFRLFWGISSVGRARA
jgi:hypothetical protein